MLIVLPLVAVGWVLAAPQDLAAVRLAGVGLAWWATAIAGTLALLAILLGPRSPGPPRADR
jgi:hypothetical protein